MKRIPLVETTRRCQRFGKISRKTGLVVNFVHLTQSYLRAIYAEISIVLVVVEDWAVNEYMVFLDMFKLAA